MAVKQGKLHDHRFEKKPNIAAKCKIFVNHLKLQGIFMHTNKHTEWQPYLF